MVYIIYFIISKQIEITCENTHLICCYISYKQAREIKKIKLNTEKKGKPILTK